MGLPKEAPPTQFHVLTKNVISENALPKVSVASGAPHWQVMKIVSDSNELREFV